MVRELRSNAASLQIIVIAIGLLGNTSARAEFGDELFKLTASDAAPRDGFGSKVAVSGEIAIVGGSGSAYLFDSRTAQELFKLTASDASERNFFGGSVDISGNRAIVGGSGTNKAYVFDVTTGQELRNFIGSDFVAGDFFWRPVAISGNTAIVGAEGQNHTGAAYVFDVTTGEELFKFIPSDGMPGDRFGVCVDISGNVAIVGARQSAREPLGPGAVYVFDVTTGHELFKLTASDGQSGDYFGGWSVDISGRHAIVSGPNNSSDIRPAAYVFDTTTGRELRRLYTPDANEDFGWSVAISGNTAILGARNTLGADLGSYTGWGAAYLFDISTGELLKTLIPSDTHQGQWFGNTVAIDDNTAIVGAPFGDKGTIHDTGSAYLFDVSRHPTLIGDFNNDGTVDAADYLVWRNRLGTTYTQADYDTWRANFGRSAAGAEAVADTFVNGSSTNIPEPTTAWLLFGVLVLVQFVWSRTSGHSANSHRNDGPVHPTTSVAIPVACQGTW
jgi:hypothetical protein